MIDLEELKRLIANRNMPDGARPLTALNALPDLIAEIERLRSLLTILADALADAHTQFTMYAILPPNKHFPLKTTAEEAAAKINDILVKLYKDSK